MNYLEKTKHEVAWPNSNWPHGVSPAKWAKENIAVVRFPDHATYAAELKHEILHRASRAENAESFPQSLGLGTNKIYDIGDWDIPAAALIDARAKALFGKLIGNDKITTERSWASIYKAGDWVAPHSHPYTLASVLYILDLGDDPEPLNGRFAFADPRLNICCQEETGYMTNLSAPNLTPGSMVCFPGKAVHFVSPYHGSEPRITMSWNFNRVL